MLLVGLFSSDLIFKDKNFSSGPVWFFLPRPTPARLKSFRRGMSFGRAPRHKNTKRNSCFRRRPLQPMETLPKFRFQIITGKLFLIKIPPGKFSNLTFALIQVLFTLNGERLKGKPV